MVNSNLFVMRPLGFPHSLTHEPEMRTKKAVLISSLAPIMLIITLLTGCVDLEVLSSRLDDTSVTTTNSQGNSESDYAVRYTVQVRNNGLSGKVRAMARLQLPGAQYYREELVEMESDEVRTLEFTFTEPTIVDLLSRDKFAASFDYKTAW